MDCTIYAEQYTRKTIYHSPQRPGFTCWTGAWMMPDDSMMVCFTQATGPLAGRPQAPKDILEKLSWPPHGERRYDMTGLELKNVHLRSFDDGDSWEQVSADLFRSPMNGITGECEVALNDGTVLRGVWGFYLPFNPELPQTGYLQRSNDGTKTWGPPEVLLEPQRYTAWPKRLRLLRDGRLIVLGGLARVPADSRSRREYNGLFEPLLMVSEDGGKSWSEPIDVVPAESRTDWGGEEFDAAELANGDLLCVFRRGDPQNPTREVRWQGVLKRTDKTWVPEQVCPAPFPHSGHPELLATRQGIVLHIATTGIDWTSDAGNRWEKLNVPATNYYPRSVQAADGRIYIFSHVGGDNPYGAVDQSITMETFRLVQ
ncbi:MAG: sialidase family protein [Candidatus Poribacteria bacterium]|nr:sialidase family protein [Candidatus Poribacteria bacterium]